MTTATAHRTPGSSVDAEAAALRRRWSEGETSPELVMAIARFEDRTGRVIVAPGEGTRPGLLEVVEEQIREHPGLRSLHRWVREGAWAVPRRLRTVTWIDDEGLVHVDWPAFGIRMVPDPEAPEAWRVGTRTWDLAREPFRVRKPVWRVRRRLMQTIPDPSLEELEPEATKELRWNPSDGSWRTGIGYFVDTPRSTISYSMSIAFRPDTGEVELFESIDDE